MKRLFLFSLLFLLAMGLTAAPTITVLHSGDAAWGDTSLFKAATEKILKDFPGVTFEWLQVDQSTGSTISMDALLKAGTPPNLYIDSSVRTSKYIVPEFALPLNGLVRDLTKYLPGVLDAVTRGGKILALPMPGSAQGMCINLDIMKDIGYTVPKDWTIEDFLKMAALVKAKYNGTRWATGMFAGNQSGDYLLNNWFASFGVKWYEGGNYDRSVVADTGGAKVYRFYQDLVRAGFVPPNAATLNDDDLAVQWQTGKLAATAFFEGWTKSYFDNALTQGLIKKPHEYMFVAFPHAPGVKNVPTYANGAVMVGHKTGTDADTITARLMEYLNSPWSQDMYAKWGNIMPNRSDATYKFTDPRMLEIIGILNTNGLQDVGLFDPRFTERRAIQYPILQKVLNLAITPEAAIAEFQAKLSAVGK